MFFYGLDWVAGADSLPPTLSRTSSPTAPMLFNSSFVQSDHRLFGLPLFLLPTVIAIALFSYITTIPSVHMSEPSVSSLRFYPWTFLLSLMSAWYPHSWSFLGTPVSYLSSLISATSNFFLWALFVEFSLYLVQYFSVANNSRYFSPIGPSWFDPSLFPASPLHPLALTLQDAWSFSPCSLAPPVSR